MLNDENGPEMQSGKSMTLRGQPFRQDEKFFCEEPRRDLPTARRRSILNRMTDIPSPCIDVCDVDSSGKYCIGCGRSMDEIASWLSASDDERRAIMQELPERLRQLKR
jgi:uncharacterized protein